MTVAAQSNTTELLHELLATRILILDGAMGTMIQRYKLQEADFRGQQFANHPRQFVAQGLQRPVVPHAAARSSPRFTGNISKPGPTSSRRTRSTPRPSRWNATVCRRTPMK